MLDKLIRTISIFSIVFNQKLIIIKIRIFLINSENSSKINFINLYTCTKIKEALNNKIMKIGLIFLNRQILTISSIKPLKN